MMSFINSRKEKIIYKISSGNKLDWWQLAIWQYNSLIFFFNILLKKILVLQKDFHSIFYSI